MKEVREVAGALIGEKPVEKDWPSVMYSTEYIAALRATHIGKLLEQQRICDCSPSRAAALQPGFFSKLRNAFVSE